MGMLSTTKVMTELPTSDLNMETLSRPSFILSTIMPLHTRIESKLHDLAISTGYRKYRNILALTVRQVFGSIEITIPSGTNPTNMKDVMVFIKELSSNRDKHY